MKLRLLFFASHRDMTGAGSITMEMHQGATVKELFEKLAATLGTTVSPKEKGFLDWLNEALGG